MSLFFHSNPRIMANTIKLKKAISYIVDLVAEGTPQEVMKNDDSLTGRFLSGKHTVSTDYSKNKKTNREITLHGANLHNLKNLSVSFPVGLMTCVTGVSGSGKSSLVSQTLFPGLANKLRENCLLDNLCSSIEGEHYIKRVIEITQAPLSRNSRSIPATYVSILKKIRNLFANTEEAQQRNYSEGHFSFNTTKGRCPECKGQGEKKVEMHFLSDITIPCSNCGAQRFKTEILEVKYKDKSIADVLNMDVDTASEFFKEETSISSTLNILREVGLGYIKLGQSTPTLSGGEAQRLKLARELSKTGGQSTLYILDEPTTGLHFYDIEHLISLLQRLTAAGSTVIIIEHNLDVIRAADWVIDLGPDGGNAGGEILFQGPPEKLPHAPDSITGQYL